MANYSNLIATIQSAIRQNGNGEITGQLLQTTLAAMVASLGSGFQYKGVATPSTNPGSPDYNVFYLATEGNFRYFGGLSVGPGEVAILKYNGNWQKDLTGIGTAASIAELSQKIDGANVEEQIPITGFIDGKYVYYRGTWAQVTTYATGCYATTPAQAGDIVTLQGNANTAFAPISIKVENTIIPIMQGSGNKTYTYTVQEDCLVYVSCLNTSPYNAYITREKYQKGLTERIENAEEQISEIKGASKLFIDFDPDADSRIVSPFNSAVDIATSFKLRRSSTFVNNPCFNFSKVSLIDRQTDTETIIHQCDDDICPAEYGPIYLGANHANPEAREIKATGHGKTYADIGSTWFSTDGNYFLVRVIDENTLLFVGENYMNYPVFRFRTAGLASGKTLTHVSGATHTGNIVIETSTATQYWSSLRVNDVSVFVDGNKVVEDGEYLFSTLAICENYDVYNPASVLNKIIQGAGTYTDNPTPNSFTTADKLARHSITYRFNGADKWTIATDILFYQTVFLNYFGFSQQAILSGTNRKMYIPKTLPLSGKDFRTIENIPLSAQIDITSEYWENPALPPDRYVQFSDYIGLHSGYLFDYGVGGENRKDYVNNAIMLFSSGKTYPHGIDSKITISAGDVFSAVVWRTYIDRAKINSNGIIATNIVEYAGKCYIYADFNAIGTYEIDVPGDFVGRDISVFEKSANITVLSKLANGNILVKVETASPMYGYLVAQIK